MFDLYSKVALVTGSGSGIGAAIARKLASAGATVCIAERDTDTGEAVASNIRSNNGKAWFHEADVSCRKSCEALTKAVYTRYPHGVDILVNNAGIGHVGSILHTEPEQMDRLYAVNVKGVYFLSKLFLDLMIERRSGSIIKIASIGGIVGIRDRFAYCMTKFAVVGMTKAMALDHADSQVRINCICPARVETPFVHERLSEYPDPEKAYREMSSTQALGRMAKPDEIAAAALYLASDEAAFITGSALIIDGGFIAGK